MLPEFDLLPMLLGPLVTTQEVGKDKNQAMRFQEPRQYALELLQEHSPVNRIHGM